MGCLIATLFIVGGFLGLTTLIMVLSGALGHVFEQPVLFIGFWEAAIVSAALAVIRLFFRSTNSS